MSSGVPIEVLLHLSMSRAALASWYFFDTAGDNQPDPEYSDSLRQMGSTLLRGLSSDAGNMLMEHLQPRQGATPDDRYAVPLAYMAVSMARVAFAVWGIYNEAAEATEEPEQGEIYRGICKQLVGDVKSLLLSIRDLGLDDMAGAMAESWGPALHEDLWSFLSMHPPEGEEEN